MPNIEEISPDYSFDNVRFAFATPTDIARALKKAWRNVALSHKKTEPMIKSMAVYLYRRLEGNETDYNNKYICLSLNIPHKTQVSMYMKKHYVYWSQSMKYRMRLAVAIEYMKSRDKLKQRLFYSSKVEESEGLIESDIFS